MTSSNYEQIHNNNSNYIKILSNKSHIYNYTQFIQTISKI